VFFADLREAVDVARELRCTTLMVLSNELGEGGEVSDTSEHIPSNEKYVNLLEGLKGALDVAPADIDLVLEPLNTKVDHPGYFLQDMATAASLIRTVNNPRLKILADLYHLGVMGEDLRLIIDDYTDLIGYVHVADFPGRHEPGTGSADWANLLIRIKERGYNGSVGFEYSPIEDSERSLRAIRALWDRAVA
jgi:hydroxypyruvate isomerase